MMMNHTESPYFDLSSIFPANYGASLAPNSLQHKCPVCPFSLFFNLPKLEDSPALRGELHSTSACEELGYGCACTLEEAPNSKHGQEGRQKLSGTRRGGERGMNKSSHSMYKGVRKRKEGRWVSEIREPGKKTRIWLGTFSTPEMAASAYDVAAFNLKTPYAYLNFPEFVSSLPIPPSRSPKHIQEAAAAAGVAALRGLARCSHIGRRGGLVATHLDETSTEQQQKQSTTTETKALSLTDDDMTFDSPNLLADMAEGLMITPPLHYIAKPTNADDKTACDLVESFLWNL